MFEIKLETVEEINIVLSALGKLPLEQSLPIWQKVKAQAVEQLESKKQPTNTAGATI